MPAELSFSCYFESYTAPSAETLFLFVLSILALKSAKSIRFLYRHFLAGITEKSLNAFYYMCSYAKIDYSKFMNVTARMALKLIPKILETQPVFLCIDDTMVSKFGRKFENVSKLFDHAAHNGSNYLNGHCFVSVMLCIPVWNKQNAKQTISYLSVPLGYCMWTKKETKLELAASMVRQAMPEFQDKRNVIILISMDVEDAVWTPYSVMSSSKWNRWYQNRGMGLPEASGILPDNTDLKGRMLMKLYGSCRRPYQMLLSGQDMELFYLEEDDEMCCTKFLLAELFRKKNLFFWGLDSIYCSRSQDAEKLLFAPGISKLLEDAPEEGACRYLYLEDKIPAPNLEKYHIQRICPGNGAHEVIEELYGYIQKKELVSGAKEISESGNETADAAGSRLPETEETLGASEAKKAERRFWTLYSRRRESQVPDREKEILNKILDSEGKKWTRKSISLLAVSRGRRHWGGIPRRVPSAAAGRRRES